MADAPVMPGDIKTDDQGRVAVHMGNNKWAIYDSMDEAAAGIKAQPDLHKNVLGGILSGLNDAYKSNIAQPVSNTLNKIPYVGGIASSMVPQNLAELGATGASMLMGGPLGLGAKAAARPILAAAGRVAIPALTAMGISGLSGEDTAMEGLKAGVGSAAGEIMAPLMGLGKQLMTRSGFVRQGMKDASDLVGAIRQEVPGLNSVINGVKDLFAGRDGGKRVLGDAFQGVDNQVGKAFGQAPITFPVVEDGAIVTKQIPMAEAGQAVRDLKEMARKAWDSAKTSTDFKKSNEVAASIQKQADQAEAAYTRILAKKDPNLSNAYADANVNYKKGIKILDLLKDSGAIQNSPAGTYLNNENLARYLTENIEKYPLMQYPELWRVATRGAPGSAINPGLSDVVRRGISGERLFLPNLGPIPGGSVPLPALLRVQRAGSPASVVGQGMMGMSQGLTDILGQRLTSGVLDQGQ